MKITVIYLLYFVFFTFFVLIGADSKYSYNQIEYANKIEQKRQSIEKQNYEREKKLILESFKPEEQGKALAELKPQIMSESEFSNLLRQYEEKHNKKKYFYKYAWELSVYFLIVSFVLSVYFVYFYTTYHLFILYVPFVLLLLNAENFELINIFRFLLIPITILLLGYLIAAIIKSKKTESK